MPSKKNKTPTVTDTGNVYDRIFKEVMADFNNTPADAVIRLIISKLRQVSHSEQELKSSLNQLTILSRLRKLEAETIQTASAMPITIDIKQDYLYNKGLEEGKLEGILEGKLEGKLEGEAKGKLEAKMVTMIETDLELLCRMAKENVSYDLMQRLSDVPEPFLAAFRSAWSADKARTLLALVAQTRERSGVDNIRQQLMDALVAFGIPQEASKSYLKGII